MRVALLSMRWGTMATCSRTVCIISFLSREVPHQMGDRDLAESSSTIHSFVHQITAVRRTAECTSLPEVSRRNTREKKSMTGERSSSPG